MVGASEGVLPIPVLEHDTTVHKFAGPGCAEVQGRSLEVAAQVSVLTEVVKDRGVEVHETADGFAGRVSSRAVKLCRVAEKRGV